MKRFFITLLAATMVFAITAPAMAKNLKKIQAETCLFIDDPAFPGDGPYFFLGAKSQKSIRLFGQKTKPYLITGWTTWTTKDNDRPMPLVGTGFVSDPEANIITALMYTDYYQFYTFEMYWNPTERTGNVWIFNTGDGTETSYEVSQVNCKTGEHMPPVIP